MNMCVVRRFLLFNHDSILVKPSCSYLVISRYLHQPIINKNTNSNPEAIADVQSIKLLYPDKINKLNDALTKFNSERMEKNRQLLRMRHEIVEKLNNSICAKTNGSLILVGSLASGLAIDQNSDIDLAFISFNEQLLRGFWEGGSVESKKILMKSIAKVLLQLSKTEPEFKLAEVPFCIYRSYIPVIVCKFKNGMTMDIQIPRMNYQSLRNTLMIRQYLAMDQRFPQVFYWLNRIFKQIGIKNNKDNLVAGKMLFSSYQTLMLVLHFLNCRNVKNNLFPPILESMHMLKSLSLTNLIKQLNEQTIMPMTENWQSKCEKNAGDLVMELIDYWDRFDPKSTKIYIEDGSTAPINQNSRKNYLLHIYEPFGNVSVCRTVEQASMLKLAFRFLHDRFLIKGMYIDDFPEHNGLAEDFLAFISKKRLHNKLNKKLKVAVKNDSNDSTNLTNDGDHIRH